MTEPTPQPNMRVLIMILWVSLATAIVVTIIDWKIKSDILKAASDFYQRMGMEVSDGQDRPSSHTSNGRDSVLPLPDVDSVARVEAAILGENGIATSKTRKRAGNVRRREVEDSPGVSTPVVEPADGPESS